MLSSVKYLGFVYKIKKLDIKIIDDDEWSYAFELL
jgi:hypothetical protein